MYTFETLSRDSRVRLSFRIDIAGRGGSIVILSNHQTVDTSL